MEPEQPPCHQHYDQRISSTTQSNVYIKPIFRSRCLISQAKDGVSIDSLTASALADLRSENVETRADGLLPSVRLFPEFFNATTTTINVG